MIPLRLVSPLADLAVLAALLLVSAATGAGERLRSRGRLEEASMPDWQRRDLALLDGRDRRPCPPADGPPRW